ncbi:ACT domain-containing protein [Spirosoma oryzae]|uniref:ACT domain-containing protein n=1 Tax=Spirosoma oryzae TaxID=1469603 RepID=A0A2T0T2Q1_9BACT|nr:ACT domain-containing protein [Spirosoma oryzae]PRY39932.1 ACT domain-containing protein [Spirosoma oryzae]
MNSSALVSPYGQVFFDVIGFDRVQFVSDVLAAATGSEQARIAHLSFEADGVRSTGRLTVQVTDSRQLEQIDRRLQLVRGLIRVTKQTATT